ncbi:3-cyclic-nucleotide phosphodiesterase rega [Lichtheimia corymbifera JMRC:FSU:9682]|uniref:3-cyclic-nucleotide phosphodiesterase rega n=1 Tax=Lichtheimia corymbifera JMRC:FSU:9682 TaxID=1263082 RepID=A0A068RL85_9FUNG|nr:3-cyclic-nucleotide phosphodiesterase rega [Lichtheimia corymbifera JMRC:FSU:9682]
MLAMDPSHCSIVVLDHSNTRPYRIQLYDDDEDNDNSPEYISILEKVFGQVSVHTSPADALQHIQKQQQPTICLIDFSNDTSTDDATALIMQMITPNISVAVCSTIEDFDFMFGCINAGASEYLIKPLRADVIRTLPLKLHRHQPTALLHHRLTDTTTKDSILSKTMMEIYAPSVSRQVTHISDHRAAFLRHKIENWDFCPFDVDHDDLIHCSYLIFERVLNLPEMAHISISKDQLYNFIVELSVSYHNGNPYHNFAHAVDVLQCCYYFLGQLGLVPFPNQVTRPQDLLRPNDVFALLIAALGHDAAHPGVNNMFMVNSATPLALLYNDRSVLESFHSMTLFQILKKHGIDQCLKSASEYQDFRKTVVATILATDMSLHNDYVSRIKEQAIRLKDVRSLDPAAQEEERILLCSALIKCADISNVTRPFRRAIKWAELLAQEFACQGDLERQLGMPVQPMNDRDKMVLEDMQIGFIRFVAMNLFQSVADVTHEISFTVETMEENLKRWEDRKHNQQQQVVEEKDSIMAEATVPEEKREPECRHSMDKSQILKGLPQMPAVAMSSYGNPSNNTTDSHSATPDWGPQNGPQDVVYCQCTIM